jgi:hypothetical protein
MREIFPRSNPLIDSTGINSQLQQLAPEIAAPFPASNRHSITNLHHLGVSCSDTLF